METASRHPHGGHSGRPLDLFPPQASGRPANFWIEDTGPVGDHVNEPSVANLPYAQGSGGGNPARAEVRARHQIQDSAAVQDELDRSLTVRRTHVPAKESQTVVSTVEISSDATAVGVRRVGPTD